MNKTTKARLRRGENWGEGSAAILDPEPMLQFEVPIQDETQLRLVDESLDPTRSTYVDMSETQKGNAVAKALETALAWIVQHDQDDVKAYVDNLRSKFPNLSKDALAQKLITKSSLQAGTAGLLTGMWGLFALPVTVPANLLASWRIQAVLTMRIAYLYEAVTSKEELLRDILMVMFGANAKSALARAGIATAENLGKKAVDRFVTAAVMEQIWKVIPRWVLTKAGQKSMLSFTRMVPGIGGILSFAFDWTFARAVGLTAIKYYRDMT